jgi:hypothetical protein
MVCLLLSGSAFAQYNIEMESILSPLESGYKVCDSIPITILVNNNGDEPSPNVPFVVTIRSMATGQIVFGPSSGQIGPMTPTLNREVTLPTLWKPTIEGQYSILIVGLTNDPNSFDDTLRTIVSIDPSMTIAEAESIVQTEMNKLGTFPMPPGRYLIDKATTSLGLFIAGTVISDAEGSFLDTLKKLSYVGFVDLEPNALWYHPVMFVYIDACSGIAATRMAQSVPVINGTYRDMNSLAASFSGGTQCPVGPAATKTELTATSNTSEWAIIGVGPSLDKWDKTCLENDVERAKDYLNGAGTGPKVNGTNVNVVDGAGAGMTKKQLFDAIDALRGKECTKVFFYYMGHGYNGGMVLRKEGGGTEHLSYRDLANKFLTEGIQNVCIVIMACYSGSATDALKGAEVKGPGGTRKKLKGVVVTSSSSSSTTKGAPDGSPFDKAFISCGKDPNADQNKDGHVSLVEACVWARAVNDTLRKDGASCTPIDSGKASAVNPPTDVNIPIALGSANVTARATKLYYPPKKVGNKTEAVCRIFLYVTNNDTKPFRAQNRMRVFCDDPKNKGMIIDWITLDMKAGERLCIAEIPADCKKIRLEYETSKPRKMIVAAGNGAHIAEERTLIISRGELLYERFNIPGDSGTQYTSASAGPQAWGAAAEPSSFFVFDSKGEDAFTVTALMPDTAKFGGMITASAIPEGNGDTLHYPIKVLVYDSLQSANDFRLTYDHSYLEYFAPTLLLSRSQPLNLNNSVLSFVNNGKTYARFVSAVNPNEVLITGDRGAQSPSYSLAFGAGVNWQNTTVWQPDTVTILSIAKNVKIDGGGIIQARGPAALRIEGNQSTNMYRGLHIDSSAGIAILGVGAEGCNIDGFTIRASGGLDVSATGGSGIRMIDSYFDAAKVSCASNADTIVRAWTTFFVASDLDGKPVKNVQFVIRDQLGGVVADEKTDDLGFTIPRLLPEFVLIGSTKLDVSNFTVTFRNGDKDSTINYKADDRRAMEIVVPEPIYNSVNDKTPSPFGASVYPNPAVDAAHLQFTLPSAGKVSVVITDVTGKTLFTTNESSAEGMNEILLPIEKLAAGYYIATITLGDISERVRIIKH